MVEDTEQDGGIIELTQVVSESSSDAAGQEEVEFADITSQIDEPKKNGLDPDFDAGTFDAETFDAKTEDTDESVLFEDNDFDFDLDMDEPAAAVSGQENEVSEPALAMESIAQTPVSETVVSDVESSITQEQVDAALERVIEKKFSKKIEKILFEVVEKVLEKEIDDIRKRLQKDLEKIANS
ncbi:MAG: hypothetical protein GY710_22135 [Desulfobacteraceae bacterium]|nr:hypothetical protein [Desulfobacteraceae bacterium]